MDYNEIVMIRNTALKFIFKSPFYQYKSVIK